jgi:heme exporter protein C
VNKNHSSLFAIGSALLIPVAIAMVFLYAPTEKTMGSVQKIFYFHVPLAMMAFLSFFVAFIAGIMYLRRKQQIWDARLAASVEIGVVLTTLVLITGSLWGKPIWNTYWTWDPRLTTSLILWFIFASCLILRSAVEEEGKRATYSAVMAIVGFIDVPIVFLSARLFRSIHPTVIRSDSVGLESSMLITLIVCLIAMLVFWISLYSYRVALQMQETVANEILKTQQ